MTQPGSSTVQRLKLSEDGGDDRRIGTLLIDCGKLSLEMAEAVLLEQQTSNLRFGEAAIKLGLVTELDVQQVLAKQFAYPYLLPGKSAISEELVAVYQPFGREVEALRALRTQLMLRWFSQSPERRALAIVSSSHGDGRSYIAANLAVVFSQLGQRTLLVDADMRRPRQHALFGIANSLGLSTILAGRAAHTAIQRIPALVDLSVLTAGPVPPNPVELLDRPAFSQLVAQFSGEYDVVLFDTPAAGESGDVYAIAPRAGAAFIVTRQYHTRVREMQALATMPNTQVLGAVLNEF